ncbi:MAG: bacteriorhodopsin [Aggregatilineales bacterium]
MNALINFENLIIQNQGISPMTFDMVAQILTLGFAVMLAALFYFVLTIRTVAPQYRISSVLSVVVMVSAFLILFYQAQSWTQTFTFNFSTGLYELAPGAEAFSNGYRYLNWLIDVPMLLFQILFIVNITREKRATLRNWFFFSGAMMIITGYIGQFYEAQADQAPFFIWGAISTAFFIHVLYLIYRVIQESRQTMSKRAGDNMQLIWYLFFVSWMLYPGAYLMPVFLNNEAGIVGRQLTYTVADIASKVIYGVMLTYVAQIRSEEEGFVSDMGVAKAAS